ncbi:helix-turn-helix domain-containing protein [Aquabacterium soli]|uniref:helix-turn-helix domain-containing protein n=1 Tax=Aquabacterium soli TaxID=2493092 RepID=UPI001F1CD93D|nr:helix-turn-helix domain-containing protein [Aquabacterium soli]
MSAAFIITPERRAALHAIRDSIPGCERSSQKQRILTAIQQLGSVTTFECMRHLDCYDPRPRKLELVQDGHPIMLAWDRMATESGTLHRVGRYYLARDMATEVTA